MLKLKSLRLLARAAPAEASQRSVMSTVPLGHDGEAFESCGANRPSLCRQPPARGKRFSGGGAGLPAAIFGQ